MTVRTLRATIACFIVTAALVAAGAATEAQTTPATTATPRPSSTSQDNLTYHRTNARLGWYDSETQLTAANVATSAFHLIGTMTTAGKSYSQPLYVSNQTVSGGAVHNLLIVTDSTDVVYAYDADSLALVWKRTFTGTGVRQQLASDISCNDTWPNIGINGTPVIDRTRNLIYVVVPTNENGTDYLRLHAISLTNGTDSLAPVVIESGSTGSPQISPKYNFNRAGLLELNNVVYVALSTHCDYDSGASHGWLLSYSASTLAQQAALFDTTPAKDTSYDGGTYLGSIWQGGFGIAADAENRLFFATGNGPNDAKSDFGQSVLRVSASLSTKSGFDYFTPSTWEDEALEDKDLGSGGVMVLPDQTTGPFPHLAIAGGKTGEKYLLNRDALGGLHSPDRIPHEQTTGGGQFGGPAYYVDGSGNQKILYGGSPDLYAYTLTTKPFHLILTSNTNVGSLENRNQGVTPVVSSNGTAAGTAVVWTIQTPNGSINGSGAIKLFAFDGANLAHTLYSATAGAWTGNGDTGGALITPLVANGRVYLATDGTVSVFGIH